MKIKKKTVRVKITHDRLTVTAQYATGGSFRFTISRSGERLTWGGSANGRVEMEKFMAFAAHRTGENNAAVCERIRVAAEAANSIAELVSKL
jgi:hypothetical protein